MEYCLVKMNRSPLQRYRNDISMGDIQFDPEQEVIVRALDDLYHQLTAPVTQSGLIDSFKSWISPKKKSHLKGLYIWGGVGRGKTYMVDNFFDSLPFSQKQRMHFHRFMQRVHDELKRLKKWPHPLDEVAAILAEDTRVICFDEFYVSDIADAMLLRGVLTELFALGVRMVVTSNTKPCDLYKNGLQRESFLPAIALIGQNMTEVEIGSGLDYRLRALTQAKIYHYPINATAERQLMQSFIKHSPNKGEERVVLQINGRPIHTRWCGDGVVWFDFDEICGSFRSAIDYIEVSRCFNTVLLSGVKRMGLHNEDVACRFIKIIDELYDRHVKLILSAEVPIDELYLGKRESSAFHRTRSRLIEMQSQIYLASSHLP